MRIAGRTSVNYGVNAMPGNGRGFIPTGFPPPEAFHAAPGSGLSAQWMAQQQAQEQEKIAADWLYRQAMEQRMGRYGY